tara:strand:- start:73 stop:249 length:177 start_codon:yes stop_codon:yes gene_type:complete
MLSMGGRIGRAPPSISGPMGTQRPVAVCSLISASNPPRHALSFALALFVVLSGVCSAN